LGRRPPPGLRGAVGPPADRPVPLSAAAEAGPLAGLDPQGRAAWARDRLVERIAEEVDELEATYHDLDHASIELDRAGAATRALFDTSKESILARKYEAAAERGFYRALREFDAAEAEAESARPEPLAPTYPTSTAADSSRASLASFFRGDAAAPGRDEPAPPSPRPGHSGRPESRPDSVGMTRSEGGSSGVR